MPNLVGQAAWLPNPPIQPTPLAASGILAILSVKICCHGNTTYQAVRLVGN